MCKLPTYTEMRRLLSEQACWYCSNVLPRGMYASTCEKHWLDILSDPCLSLQVDTLSARTCSSTKVVMQPPAKALSAADVSAALTTIDLTQLNKTQNPVDIAQAAR